MVVAKLVEIHDFSPYKNPQYIAAQSHEAMLVALQANIYAASGDAPLKTRQKEMLKIR